MSNDYRSILNRLLDNVDDTLDKRQGSIIYDALAPAAMELAECYAAMDIYYEQTYLATATGINLDNRVADYGLTRNPPTYAIRIVEVRNESGELYDIQIGDRFSIPEEYGGYNYTLIEKINTGRYKAQCQTAGIVGNSYLGVLLPLYNISGLGEATIVGTFAPAEDEETDENLRKRALNKLNKDAFGGNQADYRRYMDSIDGVGGVKIFPIWNGGGTVKISFVNSDYSIPSNEFVDEVQTLIDPIMNHGEGLGLAPIGHSVTVTKPTSLSITISATISLENDVEPESIQPLIVENLQAYIRELQEKWENSNNITIYRSKVTAAIITIDGISNVSTVKINNTAADLTLTENATLQQFPIYEGVNITWA